MNCSFSVNSQQNTLPVNLRVMLPTKETRRLKIAWHIDFYNLSMRLIISILGRPYRNK